MSEYSIETRRHGYRILVSLREAGQCHVWKFFAWQLDDVLACVRDATADGLIGWRAAADVVFEIRNEAYESGGVL